MFGTAGLPHILMRFFTVKRRQVKPASRVFWATTFIGYFYILTFIIGFGAIVLVGSNPDYATSWTWQLQRGGRAEGWRQYGGGASGATRSVATPFFGFICAVAFATILAVVSGLTLSGASADQP